jgi:D-alanine-D-alanine ligase
MRVGFVYNVRSAKRANAPSDEEAEFDDPVTIAAIRDAIASHGHDVVGLEADATLPAAVVAANVDVVFNIAEGRGSRSRESQVPALLDLLGIPYTGSDAVALGVTLDKSLAKMVVRAAGIATPLWTVMTVGDEPLPEHFRLPAIVKPLHEGSSKGIEADSVATDERRLRRRARDVIGRYEEPVLCEEYIAGREITVGLLGSPARVLPPMEVVFLGDEELPLYSFDVKKRFEELVRYEVPAELTDGELAALERDSLAAFAALGCRDVARLDFRLAANGMPTFLECNPLPGLAPGVGDLTFIAEAAGISFERLIGEILECALRRMP